MRAKGCSGTSMSPAASKPIASFGRPFASVTAARQSFCASTLPQVASKMSGFTGYGSPLMPFAMQSPLRAVMLPSSVRAFASPSGVGRRTPLSNATRPHSGGLLAVAPRLDLQRLLPVPHRPSSFSHSSHLSLVGS